MNHLSIDLALWSFPASLILGTAFLIGLWALDRHYRSSRIYRALSSLQGAIVLTSAVIALLIVEGIWALGMHHTWPFLAVLLLLATSLGVITLRRLRTHPDAGFLLNHAGLFVIVWGALFGAPDTIRARMIVPRAQAASLAYTASGEAIPLPFEVWLDDFQIDYYDDGVTPRQFRSTLRMDDRTAEVAVNAPIHHGGYTIYQDSYDTQHRAYTVLLLVRDPWLWVIWLGIAMLAAGSLFLLFRK